MCASKKQCDVSEEVSAAISAIILEAANREISKWIADQRNMGELLRDGDHFETLEARIFGTINLKIDEIETIFLSITKERELVREFLRITKDKYAKAVKDMVSRYKENILNAEERLLGDAASEFNDFMMQRS